MNNKPFFSVVIPLYNKEKHIKETLQSVLDQTFTNFEIIIVDDGSKDKSCEIVETIKDHRIRLIHQENGGPSKARNHGIREAAGKFIAFLDADDVWLPEKLQKHYELHSKNPEIVWSCSAYKVVRKNGEQHVCYSKSGILNDAIDALLELPYFIFTSVVVIRKDVFENERLFFDEEISRSEDMVLWYRMAAMYPKVGYIDEELAIYDQQVEGSLTKTAMEDEDFSFLSLYDRVDVELKSMSEERRAKLVKIINRHNNGRTMAVWRDSTNFKSYKELFHPYIDDKLLKFLNVADFLPRTVKHHIVRVLRRIYTQ